MAATAVGERSDVAVVAVGRACCVRLVWRVLDWRNEWLVATDKRMLMLYGLITKKVSMMPLVKVTDMRYSRSIPGRILGYGEFLLESAGQDQALGRIAWVADPDATYRELCAIIFTPTQSPQREAAVRRRAGTCARERGRTEASPGRPSTRHRPDDTQPIRIPPRRPTRDDGPGWAVSGDTAPSSRSRTPSAATTTDSDPLDRRG